MAVRNADVNPRQAREYLIESAIYVREVYETLTEKPEWVPILDRLVSMKQF